ncbi:hypothetical protein [Pedobacter sp.]|uniref:hypothetical protein n=1 Tax=Pedobacter sp. TaxID=1411316 RepID=UPI003D7F8782
MITKIALAKTLSPQAASMLLPVVCAAAYTNLKIFLLHFLLLEGLSQEGTL